MAYIRKSEIKLWAIGMNCVLDFFEKFFDEGCLDKLQQESVVSMKHKIISSMMNDLYIRGFTYISEELSAIGRTIGFTMKNAGGGKLLKK